ncbi:hypothetical protein [Psychrobacillus sp. FSL H8-0510]|uniref:hypothetical protein n=1 Tax=Psychrobacillus sp. FSL H8-0510 TaxID=2921394 RepID=UPI0030F99535
MNSPNEIVTLFHCTTSKWLVSILAKGLLLSNARSEIYGDKPIFLSLTPQHCFGNTCFKVCVPKDWVKQTENHWEFICNRDIPPEKISYFSYEEDE